MECNEQALSHPGIGFSVSADGSEMQHLIQLAMEDFDVFKPRHLGQK